MNTSFSTKKPYLIIPKLIEQSTWGGHYILQLKNWQSKPFLKDKKIGQSYELFGDSKLALHINDSENDAFIPEFGFADKSDTIKENFNLEEHTDFVTLSTIVKNQANEILGPKVNEKYGTMPLLIKMNQAAGNSFQLHVKPGTKHNRWQPKPESWYYLEDGYVTCGIKPEIDVEEYKKTCHEINEKMKELSTKVKNNELSLEEAKNIAHEFIQIKNPWQFVQTHEAKKYDLLDLSAGAVHHSWEENKEKFPLGNIVYEVQVDVMDPFCTIRSFDQGKLKDDGSIREIHIDDYFEFLDRDAENNNIENLRKTRQGNQLLRTPYYAVDIFEIDDFINDSTQDSFVQLYVREGNIDVVTTDGTVHMTTGHSCFIPYAVGDYDIRSNHGKSVVLKTFIEI